MDIICLSASVRCLYLFSSLRPPFFFYFFIFALHCILERWTEHLGFALHGRKVPPGLVLDHCAFSRIG